MDTQIEDIKQIRQLMERSSKFLSLSGLSGVFAGIYALLGAAVAYFIFLDGGSIKYDEYMRALNRSTTFNIRLQLGLVALGVLILAVSTSWYVSSRKARKSGAKFWSKAAKQTLYHLMVPLVAGGAFCAVLILQNNIHFVASAMLIFYGLALMNASKYTVTEIHYLGISEIVLGLLAGIWLNNGLLFWCIGFGVLHIVYGVVMYLKYDRKKGA